MARFVSTLRTKGTKHFRNTTAPRQPKAKPPGAKMNGPFHEQMSGTAARAYLDAVISASYLDDMLDILRDHAQHNLPHYSESLRAAFERVDPVFTRPRYAEFSWHCASRVPGYVPRVVLANGKSPKKAPCCLHGAFTYVSEDRWVRSFAGFAGAVSFKTSGLRTFHCEKKRESEELCPHCTNE